MKSVNALQLFKCLADASRLQILCALCKEDMYVELLAERLNLTPATISSHLKKLADVGAVKSRREQYYTVYCMCPEILSPRVIDLITASGGGADEDAREEAYRQKILNTFIVDGKIEKMPAQLKKKLVLIEEICRAFETGKPYTEKEVNLIIADCHDDFCTVRRFFVEYGLFTRENGVYIKHKEKIASLQELFER